MVYLAFGTILKVLWQFLYAFGQMFIVVNRVAVRLTEWRVDRMKKNIFGQCTNHTLD